MTSTKGFSSARGGCTPRAVLWRSSVWLWNAMLPRIDCPTVSGYSALQRVFGIGHRLPADLTSDDVYAPDPVYDLAATDASFESRQIREAAMKAHAEVSIRDRIEDSVRARPRTQTVLRADDVIMVWKTNPPSKRGRWVGPGVCIGTHRGSVWVNMRGSLWKCSQNNKQQTTNTTNKQPTTNNHTKKLLSPSMILSLLSCRPCTTILTGLSPFVCFFAKSLSALIKLSHIPCGCSIRSKNCCFSAVRAVLYDKDSVRISPLSTRVRVVPVHTGTF